MRTEERAQLIAIMQTMRGVKLINTHVFYSTGGKVKEVHPHQFLYWDTMIEVVERDGTIPITSRRKIGQGVPARWTDCDKTLTVQHPEPEWCNARFARTFTNFIQGLCPGGRVVFEAVR